MGTGTAVVITAKELIGNPGVDQGEPFWYQDVAEHLWGKTKWALELEVRADGGGQPYEVRDVFKMPNRLHRVRHLLKGPPRLRPGVVLPVQIADGEPTKLEIDWKRFERSGGTEQLYPDEPSVKESLKDFKEELKPADPTAAPGGPRPTPEGHPPVEGVDFDAFVSATVSFTEAGRPASEWNAWCEAHGYPEGRAEAINAVWYERLGADDDLRAWYTHETSS